MPVRKGKQDVYEVIVRVNIKKGKSLKKRIRATKHKGINDKNLKKKKVKMVYIMVMISSLLFFEFSFAQCKFASTNPSNSSQANAVSTTAVTVIPTDSRTCSGFIYNTGADPVRCRPIAEGDPTSTVGLEIKADKTLSLNNSAAQGWKCIRSGASDSVVEVAIERE